MKRLIATAFVCFTTLTIFAQSDLIIYQNQNISGRNYQTNQIIQEKEYTFVDRIDQFYLDSASSTLTLQLRETNKKGNSLKKTGTILMFDLASSMIKWSKSTNYETTNIKQFGDILIESNNLQSSCLNIENGKIQSKANNTIYFADPLRKIGVGYSIKFGGESTDILEGVNLKNGRSLWSKEVKHVFGWNDIFHLNDSVLILVSDGLHAINIKTGNGWDYKAVTGRKDYTSSIITTILGVTVGLLTGTFITATEPDIIREVVSSVAVDSSGIYFASCDRIVRLDLNGRIRWTFPLKKRMVSKSTLFIKDSTLYMINKGYAFMENRQINFGKPFISAYSLATGNELFFTPVTGEKSQIKTVEIQSDAIVLIAKNRVLKYSLSDGSKIIDQKIGTEEIGEITTFADKSIYIKSDSTTFLNLISDSTKHYLLTQKNNILFTDKQFHILKLINPDQYYICYLSINGKKFLAKGEETIVIDKNGNVVADLKMSQYSRRINSKLYDVLSNSVIEIDLNDVIGEY